MFAWGYLIQFGRLCFSFLLFYQKFPSVYLVLVRMNFHQQSIWVILTFWVFKKFLNLFYLFIYGCVGSLLLRGLSLVVASGGYSLLTVCRLLIAGASPLEELKSPARWAWGADVQSAAGVRCERSWIPFVFFCMCFKYCSFILNLHDYFVIFFPPPFFFTNEQPDSQKS